MMEAQHQYTIKELYKKTREFKEVAEQMTQNDEAPSGGGAGWCWKFDISTKELELNARRHAFGFLIHVYDADDEGSDEEFKEDEDEMEQGKVKKKEESMEEEHSEEEGDDLLTSGSELR
ncbi:hypothetical protein CAPTEDRAFT_202344 [Capitella teleta]|uniref:Uncharacterized protein n=1 Tax=Capitella teleta TaxID=283909 RepID=R7U1R6_CAPTE|nr:hypothetical protein CAPTEDRAFT_202344 [Capitella teleta]|eukprot:ELT97611.1 hypothetical protein CAPTEDRAFT_202344 [Capitella teleta]